MSDKSEHSDHESNTDNCKVYISNINKTIQEDDIRRKFSEFGVIKSLILKKKENNVTYSFIEYDKPSQARASIAEMDKKTYFDRILKVEYGKGGHRGLQHYHTNRYDKLKEDAREQPRKDSRDFRADKSRTYNDRHSSYSSRDSYDRYARHSPRRVQRRQRRDYKDYDKFERRPRSRSFQRQKYYREDRFKERRDYNRDDRARYYDERRYRQREDKYNQYRRDREDYAKYDKYEKDRRRDFERSPRHKYEDKEPQRYKEGADRFVKDPEKYHKDAERSERYSKQPERYDKYRAEYKEYKREGYERRREEPNDRKDSKEYGQGYMRPNVVSTSAYDKARPEVYSRTEDRL